MKEDKPKFEVGDWLVHVNGRIGKVIYVSAINVCTDGTYIDFFPAFRRATPSEIAEEKERRFFRTHDRDIWELWARDLIYINDTYESIREIDDEKYVFESGNYALKNDMDVLIEKGNVEVVCFAKDRKDRGGSR